MSDIYLIKWFDAFTVDKWCSAKDMTDEQGAGLEVESVGFLFNEDERYISLIQSTGNNNDLCGMICIPKNCIIEQRKL